MPGAGRRNIHTGTLQVVHALIKNVPTGKPAESGISWVRQVHFLGWPEGSASSDRWVRNASEHQLLVRVVAPRLCPVTDVRRTVRVVAQRMVLTREPVIAPEGEIPILDNLSVAAADDGPVFRR